MSKLCKRCMKIAQATNKFGYCQACYHIEMDDMKTAKTFIREHPNCDKITLIRETGLSLKTVTRLIEYGGIALK